MQIKIKFTEQTEEGMANYQAVYFPLPMANHCLLTLGKASLLRSGFTLAENTVNSKANVFCESVKNCTTSTSKPVGNAFMQQCVFYSDSIGCSRWHKRPLLDIAKPQSVDCTLTPEMLFSIWRLYENETPHS